MSTPFNFQLTGDHRHSGTRVRLVVGDYPGTIRCIIIDTVLMTLCESKDGQRYYATPSQLKRLSKLSLALTNTGRGATSMLRAEPAQ